MGSAGAGAKVRCNDLINIPMAVLRNTILTILFAVTLLVTTSIVISFLLKRQIQEQLTITLGSDLVIGNIVLNPFERQITLQDVVVCEGNYISRISARVNSFLGRHLNVNSLVIDGAVLRLDKSGPVHRFCNMEFDVDEPAAEDSTWSFEIGTIVLNDILICFIYPGTSYMQP